MKVSRLKYVLIAMITIFLNCLTAKVFAYDLPTLNEVKVQAKADRINGSKIIYLYAIINLGTNTGDLYSFDIDITSPKNSLQLDSKGLENGPGYAKAISDYILSSKGIVQTIPVGLWSPTKWTSGLSTKGTASWGSLDGFELKPGHTLQGYEIQSNGLPGIRTFSADPWVDVDQLDVPEEDPDAVEAITKKLTYSGKTIGPTAPPAPFVPIDFITYIIDLKHQAQNFGWIGGPKYVLELDKKLDQIKAKLSAGEIESAHEELDAFIEKVEAHYKESREHEHEMERVKEADKDNKEYENKKFITSEGYAILKFNAEYLREQLGKPKEIDDNKESEKEQKR